ncbi:FHA domain-containing protein [Bacillus sp. B-jedd]|uniref:FHA domain-containing protein n=1 Tax=Bacillus sp. B-jedd TaxID=1476857 RepID=UPI0005156E07|nr:FHA domain-containing protein [Bacillus sp. B-jedd]CEG28514.1 Forkhead-associated protein [Bacillus sp. B-jedd]
MGKTTIEQKGRAFIIEKKLTYPEAVNERELNAIAAGQLGNLLPVVKEKGKKGSSIKCTVKEMITLKSYFTSLVSKKMFLDTVFRITSIVKECERKSLNTSNLMLDADYIFIEPRMKEVKCVFLPMVNNSTPFSVGAFFRELPFGIVFSKHEDHSYMSTYLKYFKTTSPFSINSFEKMVLELMGKKQGTKTHFPTGDPEAKQGDTGGIAEKAVKAKPVSANIAYNPLSQVSQAGESARFCTQCGTGCPAGANFCPKCGTALTSAGTVAGMPDIAGIVNQLIGQAGNGCGQVAGGAGNSVQTQDRIQVEAGAGRTQMSGSAGSDGMAAMAGKTGGTPVLEKANSHPGKNGTQNSSETTVLGAEHFGGTTVLGSDMQDDLVFPYLIREKNQEKIIVDKPAYRIGKERSFCDYFISDNNAISRSHADIITRNTRYYIIDHNSTNKTYVDGRAIPVKQEVEIFSGTKLRLANEEFLFYL